MPLISDTVGWATKTIWPVKSWVLVRRWWWFDWSFTCHIAPAVTTTSIILASTKIPNVDILVPVYPDYRGKRLLSEWCCCLFRTANKDLYNTSTFQLRKWDSQHFPDHVYSVCRNWQTCFKCLIAPAVSTTSSRLLLIYTKSSPSPCIVDLIICFLCFLLFLFTCISHLSKINMKHVTFLVRGLRHFSMIVKKIHSCTFSRTSWLCLTLQSVTTLLNLHSVQKTFWQDVLFILLLSL